MSPRNAAAIEAGWDAAKLGARLHDLRVDRGWTQTEAARRADVSKPLWTYWEGGRRNMSLGMAVHVAAVLGTTVGALVEDDQHARLADAHALRDEALRNALGLRKALEDAQDRLSEIDRIIRSQVQAVVPEAAKLGMIAAVIERGLDD